MSSPFASPVSRRTVLQISGLAVATAFLASCTTPTAPSATKFTGRVVVSTAFPIPESAQQALIAAYKKQQPDVEVVFELPGTENYVPWLQTQLASGDIRPDIVAGFAPYDGYVDFQAWASKKNPYSNSAWKDAFTFKGNYDAEGQLTFIGTRSLTVPVIYNKTLFDKAGVAAAPDTWEQLVEASEKLAAIGVTPFAANFPLHVSQWMREVYFDQFHTDWVEVVRAQEGDWNYDPKKDGAFEFDAQDPNLHDKYTFSPQRYYAGIRGGELAFDTAAVTDLIANTAKVFPKYAPANFALGEDVYPTFLSQDGAMMANTPGALISLQRDMDNGAEAFDFGYFPFPKMTNSTVVTTETRAVESITGDYLSVIGKDQKQTAIVMDFLQFWLSKVGYGEYLAGAAEDDTWAGPDGPLLVADLQDPEPYTGVFDDLPSRGNAEASYNALFLNWANGQGNFRTESQQIYLDALQGKIAPDAAAGQIQAYVVGNLDAILEASQLTAADLDSPARQPGS